ncbi:hypothetical protein PM082_023177 [Marasmius tenuissimus]|nr:hypothetical protein PM082_023177 [Marasmius tenuissimus]
MKTLPGFQFQGTNGAAIHGSHVRRATVDFNNRSVARNYGKTRRDHQHPVVSNEDVERSRLLLRPLAGVGLTCVIQTGTPSPFLPTAPFSVQTRQTITDSPAYILSTTAPRVNAGDCVVFVV